MADGNKPATNLQGRDLDRAILEVAQIYPDNVEISGPVAFVVDVLASQPDSGEGRRYAIDPASYPIRRAEAVGALRRLGVHPSQERIAQRLGVSEKTIRNYDRALRTPKLGDAPLGVDGTEVGPESDRSEDSA
jgi:hypothetical protein